ncbi:MAG: NPCBM/NEW2 domain-containing protein [Verrucomicrobia bacterium]|nr:NPCBM/NEW2 domain-containing protein [Verrucomicrobiota bacterium]
MNKQTAKLSIVLAALLGQMSLGAVPPETVVPEPRDNWWMNRHAEKLQEIEEKKNEIDLVLIGDSITHFLDDRAPGIIQQTFPGITHLNLGYSADRTENVLWRLQHGEIDGLSPKLAMIMIGTNNTGHRSDPAADTVRGIRQIVEEVCRRMPQTKVLLLSVFPRGATADDDHRKLNEEINELLPSLADGHTVFHLSINEAFLDEDGVLSKEVMPDLLHPNAAGYKIWMDAVKPTVEKLLAEQSGLPTPPEIWAEYDPDEGDFKEEIVSETTRGGIYSRESYISAYVNGEEIRVYCKYAVKAGARNAPGLMDVHGWMGAPSPDANYVNDGWAVLSHGYCGKANGRTHYTKYPEALRHGNMDREAGPPVWSYTTGREPITDYRQTSDYLWYAIQRRALSYLLAQKEVDASRIGAKGYSYGGTIMWNLAMDSRVKATVAYFGIGWNEYFRSKQVWMYNQPFQNPAMDAGEKIYLPTMAPQAHAPYITAPTLWLNGSNDHHGGHERAGRTFDMFQSGVPWDFAVQARGHHNTEKLGDSCKLWLEKHVLNKKHFWPARPESEIRLGAGGVPELHLTPANPERIKELQIVECLKTANNIERYWRDVKSVRKGDTWIVRLPVMNVDEYVFSYANICYDNDCVVSSDFEAVIPSQIGDALATDKKAGALPGGADVWSHAAPAECVGGIDGFRPIDNRRGTKSEQFSDPKWRASRDADLTFTFYCTQPQTLALKANDRFAMDVEITASDEWQSMTISASQLKHSEGFALADWSEVKNIGFKPKPGSDITKVVFAEFQWQAAPGKSPEVGEDGKAYLTQDAAMFCESYWRVMEDQGVEGKPISVGGKTYARGLGVHADSKITYALNGKFSEFHVVPGPDDAHTGLVEMKILVDGKEVFSTGKVRRDGFEAQPVTVPLKDARELTLVVTDGGDGKGGDHASWADAYLVQ